MSGENTRRLSLGIDIGSTTAKIVLRDGENILYQSYERHYSRVREKTEEYLRRVLELAGDAPLYAAISGSAGLGLAEAAKLPFVQEVYATGEVVRRKEPDTSCVIELGGEDAKILFFDGGVIEERMNGSCAGGTGAFIDQMATLLSVSVEELDALSLQHTCLYPIASRCGVFAKTDIQPLLNQGAAKADIAASIYQAVVNQTIAGLAQGRRIRGKVLFLGGPLYYCRGLRQRFVETLKLPEENAVFPEYGRFVVAYGASLYAESAGETETAESLLRKVESAGRLTSAGTLEPLFQNEEEYDVFRARHAKAAVKRGDIARYAGKAWLGIDCGSTTTKLCLIGEDNELLYTYYAPNRGNPVEIVRRELLKLCGLCGDGIRICGSAVTGYGEELIRNAFSVDCGLVETIAHYTAARYFRPDVDFILDIGGQDIKCFRIRNGAIDSIFLNEACSSGCGSFLGTFAEAMGTTIAEFAEKGIRGKHPANLGSRCTVFMNSSVKQSQKDGASVEDISAGLSISVVKNALYKVIRAAGPDDLGKHIVVQGGTFYNDAVLRAFEREIGRDVIRPDIAGLMGAYGAAIHSRKFDSSGLISQKALEEFTHTSKTVLCGGCANRCRLTVNKFSGGGTFLSGNQCGKPLGAAGKLQEELPDLHRFKRDYLAGLKGTPGKRGKIGLPMALGMYELLPLWHGIFTSLGFETVVSGPSNRKLYEKGQFSIPSDTACYPAKLMHGHIQQLLDWGVETIFYPCLTYNVDEKAGDNHYNCPIVAYYSELLSGNVEELGRVRFLYPYLNINKKPELAKELYRTLAKAYPDITRGEVRRAVNAGYDAYEAYMDAVRREGERAVRWAREHGRKIMILAGRPYHIDPEIGHGIDKLACSLGFAVVSEDSVCQLEQPHRVRVLNQWTYHARLYRAAALAAKNPDMELVQLVSFGCGVDAITTDEVRSILEKGGKYYTQLKIDEITNLGAVKIRLRSLLGALEEKEGDHGKTDVHPLH